MRCSRACSRASLHIAIDVGLSTESRAATADMTAADDVQTAPVDHGAAHDPTRRARCGSHRRARAGRSNSSAMFGNVIFALAVRFVAAVESRGRRARARRDDLRRRRDRLSAQRAHGAARGRAAAAAALASARSRRSACWQVFAMAMFGGWLAWEMMLSRWDERTPYLGLQRDLVRGADDLRHGAAGLLRGQARAAASATRSLVDSRHLAALLRSRACLISHRCWDPRRATTRCPWRSSSSRCNSCSACRSASCCCMFTLLYLHTSRLVPLSVVPINMQGGISSFVMLSIPFFILAGYVMTEGGLSRRLTDFVIVDGRPLARRHAAGDRRLHVHHVGHIRLEGRRRRGGRARR